MPYKARDTTHFRLRVAALRSTTIPPALWTERAAGMELRALMAIVFPGARFEEYPDLLRAKVGLPGVDDSAIMSMLCDWQGSRQAEVSGNYQPPRHPHASLYVAGTQRLRAAADAAVHRGPAGDKRRLAAIKAGAIEHLHEAIRACAVVGMGREELLRLCFDSATDAATLGPDSQLGSESSTVADAWEPDPANPPPEPIRNASESPIMSIAIPGMRTPPDAEGNTRLFVTALYERVRFLANAWPDPWALRVRVRLPETSNGEPCPNFTDDERKAFLYVARAIRWRAVSGGEIERVAAIVPVEAMTTIREHPEVLATYTAALNAAADSKKEPNQ